jgi:hypothetical protein
MPISDKYKIIFIHIPKCAGVSMWQALDIPNIESQSNLVSLSAPILQHLLPKQLKGKYIDEKRWRSYKKITIVRNPYDRVISDYFWMKENAPHLITGTFDDFLELREDVITNNKYDQNIYFDHFYPMHFYFDKIKYDHVLRFENLEKEYEKVRKLYKIPNLLPKNNQSLRDDFKLDKQQKEKIYKIYEEDFLKFGYKKQFKGVKRKNDYSKEAASSLKVIIAGMEHSGTTFLSQLIIANSNIINSGFECGVLLADSPREFYKILPFYNWMCQEGHGWDLTEDKRNFVCDTDSFDEFYLRLIKESPLFQSGQSCILDKTPAYSYNLVDINKKNPNVPILVIIKDIETLWHSYSKRHIPFEEFVKRFLTFKKSLFDILKSKNEKIKIIKLEDIADYNIDKIEDIFSFIKLPFGDKAQKIENFKWEPVYSTFNLIESKKNASSLIEEKHRLVLEEIDFKETDFINNENNIIKMEEHNFSHLVKHLEDIKSSKNASLFEPLNEIIIQIFWTLMGESFSEEKSIHLPFAVKQTPTSISYTIPLVHNRVDFLRFDIGNQIGSLNIHDIKIKNYKEEVVWIWNKSSISYKENLLLFENKILNEDIILQLATSNDPQFVLNVQNLIEESAESMIVEIILSAINELQIKDLHQNNAPPLAFITKDNKDNIQNDIDALNFEKNSLSSQIVANNSLIHNLNSENALYKENISTLQSSIKQYTEDKTNLNNDKTLLTNEINFKNDLINELTSKKEELDNKLKTKQQFLNKLQEDKESSSLVVDGLKQGLRDSSLEVIKINNENNKNKNEIEVLKIENEKLSLLAKEREKTLENFVKELGLTNEKLNSFQFFIEDQIKDKNLLISENKNKQVYLDNLLDDHSNLKKQLLEKEEICKQMLNDADQLRNRIIFYQETYEKRSILGIIKHKFFNKTN